MHDRDERAMGPQLLQKEACEPGNNVLQQLVRQPFQHTLMSSRVPCTSPSSQPLHARAQARASLMSVPAAG